MLVSSYRAVRRFTSRRSVVACLCAYNAVGTVISLVNAWHGRGLLAVAWCAYAAFNGFFAIMMFNALRRKGD